MGCSSGALQGPSCPSKVYCCDPAPGSGGSQVATRPSTIIVRASELGGKSLAHHRLQFRDLTPEDYELLCELDKDIPRPGTLPQSIVDSLPRVLASECGSAECGVCLCELEPSSLVVLLDCQHALHPSCASRWLTTCKGTCPICQTATVGPQQPVAVEEVPEPPLPAQACGLLRRGPQAAGEAEGLPWPPRTAACGLLGCTSSGEPRGGPTTPPRSTPRGLWAGTTDTHRPQSREGSRQSV
mmetsp:Transcript_139024/g.387781  ORF Transcript_139024/g.387781 Transcript_139024/m.387781 type:complete len:241 (-) Transcript_139024:212-934(-)